MITPEVRKVPKLKSRTPRTDRALPAKPRQLLRAVELAAEVQAATRRAVVLHQQPASRNRSNLACSFRKAGARATLVRTHIAPRAKRKLSNSRHALALLPLVPRVRSVIPTATPRHVRTGTLVVFPTTSPVLRPRGRRPKGKPRQRPRLLPSLDGLRPPWSSSVRARPVRTRQWRPRHALLPIASVRASPARSLQLWHQQGRYKLASKGAFHAPLLVFPLTRV